MAVDYLNNDVVIIGGGVAAFNAIKAIRETDKSIDIHLIAKEPINPYYRTRLTKSLFDELDTDKICLQKVEWYQQNNINIYLDKEVVLVDTDNNTVSLNDGSSLKYTKLLLANGAFNFKPTIEGIDLENVYTIRALEDIHNIKTKVDEINTVLHLGGGIQNLEAAWAFRSNDKEVIIVEFMDRLMPRQLDSRGSEILKKAVEASNAKVILNTEVIKVTGGSKVDGAILRSRNSSADSKNGDSIACDMVIYSVGIRPNVKLYENTKIKIDKGVIVDEHMRTNLDNVYAAGDIAEYNGRVGGLWPIAIEQGKTSGYNIVGKDASYTELLPVTNMNAFNLNIFSIGAIDETSASLSLIDDTLDDKSYKRIFIKDNHIIGAIVIGETRYNNMLRKLVNDKIDISSIDYTDMSVSEFLEGVKGI